MRRLIPFLAIVVTLSWSGNALARSAPAPTADDWPQFHDGPDHTGWNRGEHTLGRSNVGSLTPAWSITPSGSDQFGDPLVADGKVLVEEFTSEESILALDLKSGAKLWSFSYPRFNLTAPVSADGTVYVAGWHQKDPFSPCLGRLFALDAATGTALWAVAGPCATALTIDGDRLFVGARDHIVALDSRIGSVLWDFPANGFTTLPTVGDGLVFTTSTDGNLYAIDETTGVERWDAPAPFAYGVTAYSDGAIYVGTGQDLDAFDGAAGGLLWSFPASVQVVSNPAVARGVVYFGDYGGNAYAVNASDGSLIWQRRFGAEEKGVTLAPAVADGVVYLGSDTGTLAALNSATGRPLWSFAIAPESPAVAEGMVVVRAGRTDTSSNVDLYAFGLP